MGELHSASPPGSTLNQRECRELIRQLANENACWGYLRLKGELRKLAFEVSAGTIRRVLRRHRIPPALRRSALTWRGFLAAHASTIIATDFFSVDTVFCNGRCKAGKLEDIELSQSRIDAAIDELPRVTTGVRRENSVNRVSSASTVRLCVTA